MDAEPRSLKCKKGEPVVGGDFWPRPDVVDSLVEDLSDGSGSRRLFGLRRIGKTSVIREVERRLTDVKINVVHLDVQGISRFKDFLDRLIPKIPTNKKWQEARTKLATNPILQTFVPSLVTHLAGKAPPRPEPGFVNEFAHKAVWAGDIEDALRQAAPLVLIIDELPFMLRDMMLSGYMPMDVENFLATLRGWRFNAGVRMLFSGSLGLGQLQRLHGVHISDHVGDMPPVFLPPLGTGEAADMVEALARGAALKDWSRECSGAVVAASAETWPIFLQYGFDAVRKSTARDPDGIATVIRTVTRPELDETFYSQFKTRLSRYEKDETPARVILKALVADNRGFVEFVDIDGALKPIKALPRRDDLLEALLEDDFIRFDTEAQTLAPASKLVPIWVRSRSWGR